MAIAIYPGKFDPVHNGHIDIAQRAAKLFDELIVAVYDSPPKQALFTTEERIEFAKASLDDLPNVKVSSFTGLAPGFARSVGALFIVRGLRAGYDFETEFEMTHMWRHVDPEIEVVCMMSALQNQFVYASRVKEVAQLGGKVEGLVPNQVVEALGEKYINVSS